MILATGMSAGEPDVPVCKPGQEQNHKHRNGCVFFNITFFFSHMTYGILVPQPGIKPVPCAVEAWSLNHWITREVP